ncbi:MULTISPECIES: hypothetical protein [unclassified Actinomyces]|uniref:hypothetical protein n=1 Tax=unclassified Actinomyces TaxID=2609248 RepID=UPI000D59D5A3|nr:MULTISPECIES: hypothetical protein [unclassified Actinomyces]RAX20184.1 hypothetical protein DRB06_09410 [Actinomyces sp. Z5]RAX24333.1 hypothetical protein DRB07_01075 [Actinomyces sp. Z3]
MVLRVVPEELAAARARLDDSRHALSQFHLDSGGEGLFGSAVLASAAARFAAHHEQQAERTAARANADADGLLAAQQGYASTDDEAADGAHRLAASASGLRNLGGSAAGGAVAGARAKTVTYHGLTG